MKTRIVALLLLLASFGIGYFVFSSEVNPDSRFGFKYGLDLDGGTHLTYRADTSEIDPLEVEGSMDALRRTIERRVNVFGVSEPIVQVEKGGAFSSEENDNRLIVELPGVTDISEAIKAIGATPFLEFKLASSDVEVLDELSSLGEDSTPEEVSVAINNVYNSTGLTGSQVDNAQIGFDHTTGAPIVLLNFNKEGADLFATLTRENVGQVMGIFLDGQIISAPVIRQEITGGTAQITGQFSPEEVKDLVQNINFGALPIPIELIETQTIGASLGHDTLESGVRALVFAFGIIFVFLIIWYRLPGLIAVLALGIYIAVMLAVFKLIPVVLTASGLAGFILSLGMAVDANILIFERMKEELLAGRTVRESVRDGFSRAWLSIRDGNLSSIISAIVLYWLSGTSLVKGFALVFGVGVLVSMLTAIVISRTLLLAIGNDKTGGFLVKLFGSGFGRLKKIKSATLANNN